MPVDVGVAAAEEAAVTDVCQRLGLAAFYQSGQRIVVEVERGRPSVLVESHGGVALRDSRADGVAELALPLTDIGELAPAAAGHADRLRRLPPGRYVFRAAGGSGGPDDGLVDLIELLTGRPGRRPPGLRLLAERSRRRVVVGAADRPATSRIDHWWRLTCFIADDHGRSLGKETLFGTEDTSGPPFDAEAVTAVVERAVAQYDRLVAAEPTPGGPATVVFAPAAAGVLVHEVVGHLLESDNAAEPAVAGLGTPGARIAGEQLSVTHDATGAYPWGGATFDDSGRPTGRVALVTGGVVAGLLGDGSTDGLRGEKPGHARRVGHDAPLLPRMSTLVVAPGGHGAPLADLADAILVRELARGSFDPKTGRCVLRIREGALVRSGQVRGTVRGGVVACPAPQLLRQVDAVDVDGDLSAALCTKAGQTLPVGVWSPAIRVRGVPVLGGEN